jgi:hypothetical protein
MNIVLLGGNHVMNKSWVEDIAKNVGDIFDKAVVQDFLHWQKGEQDIHMDEEVAKLAEITGEWIDYIVFAKSIGTIVALKALFEKKISPKKVVFLGFPYEHSKEQGYETDKYLEALSVPTFFIQKSEDWAMHYDDLEKLVKEKVKGEYKLLKYHRDGEPDTEHHYADIEYLKSLLKEWMNES